MSINTKCFIVVTRNKKRANTQKENEKNVVQ